jgi:hypothetical protein
MVSPRVIAALSHLSWQATSIALLLLLVNLTGTLL